jgi:hypothetical protein
MSVTADITNNIKKVAPRMVRYAPDVIFKGVQKAGGIVLQEGRRTAPKNAGRQLKQVPKNPRTGPEAWISFKKDDHWYLKFFESGAKRHDIKAKKATYLAWPISAGKFKFGRRTEKVYHGKNGQLTTSGDDAHWIRIRAVRHPGMTGTHFLDTANIKTRQEQKNAIADAVLSIYKASGGGPP